MCDCAEKKIASFEVQEFASLKSEFENAGKQSILRGIAAAGRKLLARLPDDPGFEKLVPEARLFLERVNILATEALNASEWSEARLAIFIREVGWARLTARFGSILLRNNGGGGSGSGPTCPTQCETEYDKCMAEHRCTDSFICLCCTPCSLLYLGCMAGCIRRGGSIFGGGGVIEE
jgi:hypothetical protein